MKKRANDPMKTRPAIVLGLTAGLFTSDPKEAALDEIYKAWVVG